MLSKLLKNDLKKNMRWMWIIFAATIVVAGISRGCKELSTTISFFKILKIIFDSIFYSLAVNCILQPFLRNFYNFSRDFYSDESYLTHTLPATKSQLINSKYITTLIEMILGFISLILSLIIMYASPTFVTTIKLLISTIVTGNISIFWTITLFIVLVIVEFFMFLSIIYFSIVVAYKTKEKRVLRTFLITAGIAFASISILAAIMIIVLVINGVSLSSTTLILSNTAFVSVLITGILVYLAISVLFYFLAKREFNKGINVD